MELCKGILSQFLFLLALSGRLEQKNTKQNKTFICWIIKELMQSLLYDFRTIKIVIMKHSDNQETKLIIIEQLIILNDNDVFDKIENIINESMHRPKSKKLTRNEIIQRAQLSNNDIEETNILTQNNV